MTEKSFFAGFGGQGIVSLGQIWVYSAMKEGKNVTFFPSYGAEKRGGIAQASVIVSDTEIASPLVRKADSAIVMNNDSLPLCENIVKEGGLLLVNSTLVKIKKEYQGTRVVNIEAQKIAENIGDARFANMVALGAMAELTGVLSLEKIEFILKSFFPPSKHKFIDLNIKAINAGRECVRG
jgi:2-oxoglutarate ferredoxin oxidoreductase subunit gamma